MARSTPAGELAVMFQVAPLADEEEQKKVVESIVGALTGSDLNVVSIYLQLNDTSTDAARPDAPMLCVHGKPRLEMPLMGSKFELGPLSFFQTNSVTCHLLYEKALEWARPENSVVLDVCCGVGTIGICAAKRCKRIIGLELVPEAVKSAEENAALNGISNATYYVGKAEDTLPQVLKELGDVGDVCAIVDPPRAGLHKTVLDALKSYDRVSRLVYVSCNPETLVDDVVRLCSPQEGRDAFVPMRAVAVDMFPHTLHCEMILLLERTSKVPDMRVSQEEVNAARAAAARAGGAKSEPEAFNAQTPGSDDTLTTLFDTCT